MIKFISSILSALICFAGVNFGIFSEQVETIQSVTKVCDGFYMMDYKFDYDIDEMLKRGFVTHIDLVAYGGINTFTGNFDRIFNTKGFGCTTFNSVSNDGDRIFARNFDYMDSPFMLVWTHPENGYASLSAVSLYFLGYGGSFLPEDEATAALTILAPYIPLDGINEKGLSIGVLELAADPLFQISKKPNLTTTTIIRAVLDKAATVDEAIEIFDSYDLRDMLLVDCTYHYQIADAQGNSAVIEYIDGEMNVIYPEHSKNNRADFLVAANYYLTDGVNDPGAMGRDRAEKVIGSLTKTAGVADKKAAMKLLKSVSMKDADLHGYICSTLWSAVYNMTDITVDLCAYGNYEKVYSFTLDEPCVIR